MTIAIWTFEFGEQPYFKLTDEINRAYCDRQGYQFHVFRPDSLPDDRHPNWTKVKAVQNALESQKEGLILFMDRDAYFHDHGQRVEELAARMSTLAEYMFGADRRDRAFGWGDEELNCGVFLVRCTEQARRIARDWWEVPKVRPETLRAWPLEQAAMNHLRSLEPERIQVIPYFHLAGTDGEFIRHAAGTNKVQFLGDAFLRFKAGSAQEIEGGVDESP